MRYLYSDLGVDEIISPVELASHEIKRLIGQSAFTNDYEFEGGKLTVFGITISSASPLKDKSVVNTQHLNPNRSFKPIALLRNDETIMVQGDTVLLENDIVCCICMENESDIVIFPCGHHNFCKICISGLEKCPLCRANNLEKITIN